MNDFERFFGPDEERAKVRRARQAQTGKQLLGKRATFVRVWPSCIVVERGRGRSKALHGYEMDCVMAAIETGYLPRNGRNSACLVRSI